MQQLKWKPDEPAELRMLGNGTGAAIPVRIVELSGKRVRLGAEAKVTGGAAVRLEWQGQLVLGQVLENEVDGFWVEIHHVLLETAAPDWQKQGWQRE